MDQTLRTQHGILRALSKSPNGTLAIDISRGASGRRFYARYGRLLNQGLVETIDRTPKKWTIRILGEGLLHLKLLDWREALEEDRTRERKNQISKALGNDRMEIEEI